MGRKKLCEDCGKPTPKRYLNRCDICQSRWREQNTYPNQDGVDINGR